MVDHRRVHVHCSKKNNPSMLLDRRKMRQRVLLSQTYHGNTLMMMMRSHYFQMYCCLLLRYTMNLDIEAFSQIQPLDACLVEVGTKRHFAYFLKIVVNDPLADL